MGRLKATPEWLKVSPMVSTAIGVDRDAKRINGIVVAELGAFKTPGRGEFDEAALKRIVELGNASPAGIKSRLSHPTASDDGVGKFLGREHNFRLDGAKVRADLHLAESAFHTPAGDLATYVMDRAEEDAGAISSSLVLQTTMQYRLDSKGRRAVDAEGNELPPLWMPTRLHASDIVDEGDAVHGGLLSVDALPDALLYKACEMLNQVFESDTREVVKQRLLSWMQKYLDMRYGAERGPSLGEIKSRLDKITEHS